MKMLKKRAQHGQLLIEVLIAVAIFCAIIIPFILSLSNLVFSQTRYHQRVQAANYARGGLEITYNIVANTSDWGDFVTSHHLGTFHPSNSDDLELIDGEEIIEGRFTRQITIAKVWRDDENGEIVDEDDGDNWEDDNTLKIVSKVSWQELDELKKIEFVTYLINLEVLGG